ncbi:MAG: ribosome biogenesis GTPase YlqF [Clostridia bacterium]|nr:ribosome biogenesis GTPase YlqF [Clostridia bacterium]
MPSETIQWFPGHMAKTRRLISENIKNVDIIIEILDARIPYSSRNPEIARLIGDKPTLLLLNKASLADPAQNASWVKRYTNENTVCILTDCVTGEGMNKMAPAIRSILSEKLRRYEEKGMNRRVRAMVLGIPNVGKSSLINRICGNKKAKVENRPGVTLDKQWVTTNIGVDLMDMPGILWPKFEERRVGENLALTGAIRDGILDLETMAVILCKRLRRLYPEMLSARYKLGDMAQYKEMSDYDLFLTIGKKRGFLVSGGEINTERTAITLLDEFRDAKIGRMTLDRYSKEELPDA